MAPTKIPCLQVPRQQKQANEYARGLSPQQTRPQLIKTIKKNVISADDVGLHSIRSSAAMGMYLNGMIPVYYIYLGRWSTNAFLRCIRKQVTEFSNNVSRQIIQTPAYHHKQANTNSKDPWTHNSMDASVNMGMVLALRPSIATWSQFGCKATSPHELHECKCEATCLQLAYAAPAAKSFAKPNLDHGRGRS